MSNFRLRGACLLVLAACLAAPSTAQMQLGTQPQQLLSIELKSAHFDESRRFYMEVVGLKELPGSNPTGKPKQSTSLSFSGSYAKAS